jgi:hypothetical protein
MFKIKIKKLTVSKKFILWITELNVFYLKYEFKITASECINGIVQRVHVGLVKLTCVI